MKPTRQCGNVRDNIKIKLDGANAERATKVTYQYDAGFTLQPGTYHLKFVVRENISGKMGTFEAEIRRTRSQRRYLRAEAKLDHPEQPAQPGHFGRRFGRTGFAAIPGGESAGRGQ